jgi:hypothetical protein
MNDLVLLCTAIAHSVHSRLSPARARDGARDGGDRGDVSLSQVLWFVAAGVGVAVIAGIVWGRIREQANSDIVTPTAP